MRNILRDAVKSLLFRLQNRIRPNTANCERIKEKCYRDLEATHEQYDIFLHDIKHMMRTILALSKEGNCEKISQLIKELGFSLENIEQETICGNHLLNALLSERKGYASDTGVILDIDIKEPLYLQNIEDIDLVTLLGNLLDNAIEAEALAKNREGILCSIGMARGERHIVILIENSYDKHRMNKENVIRYREQKIGNKHGIGLKSIRKVIEKYGGIMDAADKEGRYRVKVIIPVQENASGSVESTIA